MTARPRLILTLSALLLGPAALAGCDSEVVLSGNFSDWPQYYNNGDLPGDPDGDSVFQLVDGNFAMAQVWYDNLYVVDSACQPGAPCHSPARFADFRSKTLTSAQKISPFTWAISGKAYIQPGGDLSIDLYHGHYNPVATLRFEREDGEDATVTIVHGNGEQVLETLEMDEDFGYVVHADPDTSTFDVVGVPGAVGLPVISNPTYAARGFAMFFNNPEVSYSGLIIDILEAHAQE